MANTLPGTPYVESSDLVANYPAVSESLAERVDLVGILPFANSTDRGTALPTPTDGQYSYLQDTNSTEYWNGAAWVPAGETPGLRIVAPTSIANSGGSASASGGQVTFTGVSSVSLNGVFSATYQNYKIVFDSVGSGAAQNLQFRMRSGGADDTSANYVYQLLEGSAGVVTSFRVPSAATFFVTAVSVNTTSYGEINLFNPFNATPTQLTSLNGYAITTPAISVWGGGHNVSTSFDGFTVFPASGTFSGTIRCYGYQNS
jgi:hypothetical protein